MPLSQDGIDDECESEKIERYREEVRAYDRRQLMEAWKREDEAKMRKVAEDEGHRSTEPEPQKNTAPARDRPRTPTHSSHGAEGMSRQEGNVRRPQGVPSRTLMGSWDCGGIGEGQSEQGSYNGRPSGKWDFGDLDSEQPERRRPYTRNGPPGYTGVHARAAEHTYWTPPKR